ncbi:MAG TPA: VOC family protein [Bacteroidetes bacterium]|jgi:catechol 2,3-dioxygenase-like lactoylglutathione lyase family enzyme|nr:VOC family protein [Bacteroidota bacterium]
MALIHHHTSVYTTDVKASVDWYVENLQAKILKQDEERAMIMIGDMTLALTSSELHPPHIAFEVGSLAKFPCCKNEIKMHRDGSYYYYQETPDGTIIEWLYWEPALRER